MSGRVSVDCAISLLVNAPLLSRSAIPNLVSRRLRHAMRCSSSQTAQRLPKAARHVKVHCSSIHFDYAVAGGGISLPRDVMCA